MHLYNSSQIFKFKLKMDKVDKQQKDHKRQKIFAIKNFIEKEAEEEDDNKKIKKLDSALIKDTQYSSEINNSEDSYGISSENDTEKIDNKEIISHRVLLNKEKMDKEKNAKIKRKRKPTYEKDKNKKRVLNQVEKNNYKVETQLGIINGKLNICFDVNRENKEINVEKNWEKTPEKKKQITHEKQLEKKEKTPEKKLEDEDDFFVLKMSNERKRISDINKNYNKDFIKRMKDNENFVKNNNIIISDETKRSKSHLLKRKTTIGNGYNKLKLFNMKGVFLNKKKK